MNIYPDRICDTMNRLGFDGATYGPNMRDFIRFTENILYSEFEAVYNNQYIVNGDKVIYYFESGDRYIAIIEYMNKLQTVMITDWDYIVNSLAGG